MEHPDNIIPENSKGGKSDNISKISLDSPDAAKTHYQIVRQRLLSVSKWHDYAGAASAEFQVTDPDGHPKPDFITEGDYFKIDIPAPGTNSGGGYDWVQVEKIEEGSNAEEDWEYVLIRVRPASDPTRPDNNTAHFFSEDANSYFLVKRTGKEVSAEIHGRNELPNTETESIGDKIRNTVVALGAIMGISKAQWKSLTSGLVKI